MSLLNFHFNMFSLEHLVLYYLFMIFPTARQFMDRDSNLRVLPSVGIGKFSFCKGWCWLTGVTGSNWYVSGSLSFLQDIQFSTHTLPLTPYFLLSLHLQVSEGHLNYTFYFLLLQKQCFAKATVLLHLLIPSPLFQRF